MQHSLLFFLPVVGYSRRRLLRWILIFYALYYNLSVYVTCLIVQMHSCRRHVTVAWVAKMFKLEYSFSHFYTFKSFHIFFYKYSCNLLIPWRDYCPKEPDTSFILKLVLLQILNMNEQELLRVQSQFDLLFFSQGDKWMDTCWFIKTATLLLAFHNK